MHMQVGIEIVAEGKLLPDRRSLPCLAKLSLLQEILREEERLAFLKSVACMTLQRAATHCNTLHQEILHEKERRSDVSQVLARFVLRRVAVCYKDSARG